MNKKILVAGFLGSVMLLVPINSAYSNIGIQIDNKHTIISNKGNTLFVGGSGGDNYTSIQSAVNDANNGDTVFVFDDSSPYHENLKINKRINLTGEDKNTTIIQGSSLHHVIEITAPYVKIIGFTIESVGDYPDYGLYITSIGNTVNNNIIRKNDIGISLQYSDDNVISNNNFSNNRDRGIFISFSKNNDVDNNCFCNNGGDAIYCGEPGSIIRNNQLFNDYIEIKGSPGHIIINNTVNGKDIVYYETLCDIILDEGNFGQIILNNCKNITVENQNARFDIIKSNNCYISNNVISNTNYGLRLASSDNNTIHNNDIFSCKWDGLYLYNSENNIIGQNNISSSFKLYNSKYNRIESNNLSSIKIDYNSDFNTINNNFINSIEIIYSISNTVIKNNIKNNFLLDNSKLNEIENNNFEKCVFHSDFSNSNIISKNNFINSRVIFFRYYLDFLKKNDWSNNYWNKARYLPKPIFGVILLQPPPMFQILPWVTFDWHPASEPYDL